MTDSRNTPGAQRKSRIGGGVKWEPLLGRTPRQPLSKIGSQPRYEESESGISRGRRTRGVQDRGLSN